MGAKATPGLRAGISTPLDLRSCKDTLARAIADNPNKMYPEKPCVPCKQGYYRAMLSLDRHGRDHHWYRAHSAFKHRVADGETYSSIANFYGIHPEKLRGDNGNKVLRSGDVILVKVHGYSHKRGLTATTVKDSCGNFLRDPRAAAARGCADYGHLIYDILCQDLCVRVGGLKTV